MKSRAKGKWKGPERPTLTEWLIGFIPLPFIGGALLLSALVSLPGEVLALYLDTWDLTVALAGLPPDPSWLVLVQVILWVSVPFSVSLATRYMRLQVVRAEAAILPPLPRGEEAYSKIFGGLSSFWPPLAAATLLFALFTLQTGLPTGGPFTQIFDYAFGFTYLILLSTFIGVYISSTLGLHALSRESLKLKAYYEDSMLGLRPLGSLSLSLTRPFLGVTAVTALWVSTSAVLRSDLPTIGFVAALAAVGVIMFFLPLNRVHQVMERERGIALDSVRAELLQFAAGTDHSRPETSEATLDEVLNRLGDLRRLHTLEMAEQRLSKAPTWPFDTRVLRRLATTALAVITVLVSRFIAIRLFGL